MNDIRQQARRFRQEIGLGLEEPIPAEQVVAACAAAAGLEQVCLPPEAPLLAGAQAAWDTGPEQSRKAIYLDDSRPVADRRVDAAHEIAHVWRHHGPCRCAAPDLNPEETEEAAGSALSKVEDGSPHQSRENEANVFAAELLLPGPLARRLFWDEGLSSEIIAGRLGLPERLVERQLMDAVLLPPPVEAASAEAAVPSVPPAPLDAFQKQAAEIPQGPLLLGAGPGTGKTKTLVGRCRFLTETLGVPAEKMLALTFSRQAAAEMRARLRDAGVGTRGAEPWVGTFHAFGLDILRRFGDRLGLSAEIVLLDTLDAVTLLENHLPELQLQSLDNLGNPAFSLGGILKQIGRAKDELCPPERYAELCREMAAEAAQAASEFAARPGKKWKRDEDAVAKAREQAAKAGEVAHCYAVYERLMREGGYLDFADLLSRTVALLEANPDILASLQAEFPHILADEYQDVNRACARLVRLVAGPEARGLWAVGDHRQSIYRFRGASPANVAAFKQDYPNGQRLELGVNYRSRAPIVELFGVAARGMERGDTQHVGGAGSWQAARGVDGQAPCPAVTLAVAPDEAGQADGIAQAIANWKAAGRAYSDCAALCRTHGQAAALAAHLAARDIPALYGGPLLERPEVKDLLCLLSLLADQDGSGLLRVAAWPEYGVAQAETLAFLARFSLGTTPLVEALSDAALLDGLRRLGAHLAVLETRVNDPAGLLRQYLFGLSSYLRHLSAGEPKAFARAQRLTAIHQLLGLASGFGRRIVAPSGRRGNGNKTSAFLTYLRRLAASGETLRGSVPAGAEAPDAVRILTAHAAKGLEYPVVFLPNLGAGQFPARGRHDGIPEPPELASAAGQETDEEDCLFFVALSRARDTLILSRCERSGTGREVKPSPLLELVMPWFHAQGVSETVWLSGRDTPPAPELLPALPDPLPTYSMTALETYARCPRQFYYSQELHLAGALPLSGYPQFHACLRRLLDWLEDERAAGRAPEGAALTDTLEAVWAEHGPVGHGHEARYKDAARQMLQTAAGLGHEGEARLESSTLYASLPHGRVRVRPDVARVSKSDGRLIVARRMTGKPDENDKNDKRLALYRRAAADTHPDRPLSLAIHYLSDGTTPEVEPPSTDYKARLEAERVAHYDRAARGIFLRQFPAKVGDECRSCAYLLLCPL